MLLANDCPLFHAAPPYTTCVPEQVRLQAGDAVRVQCLAHGSHPIQFEWSRVGRASMPPGAEVTKDGQLIITQVKVSDSGTYKCVATNHVGSSEAVAKVVVRGGPASNNPHIIPFCFFIPSNPISFLFVFLQLNPI